MCGSTCDYGTIASPQFLLYYVCHDGTNTDDRSGGVLGVVERRGGELGIGLVSHCGILPSGQTMKILAITVHTDEGDHYVPWGELHHVETWLDAVQTGRFLQVTFKMDNWETMKNGDDKKHHGER